MQRTWFLCRSQRCCFGKSDIFVLEWELRGRVDSGSLHPAYVDLLQWVVMVRAGVRERAMSVAVVGLLLFLLLQTYISDIRMAEEEVKEGQELTVDIETYPPLQDSVLPGEIAVEEAKVEPEVSKNFYITANEITPSGRLDDMVEAGEVDMDKYIKEKEDALNQENFSTKTGTETEAGPRSQLLARPPNVKGQTAQRLPSRTTRQFPT